MKKTIWKYKLDKNLHVDKLLELPEGSNPVKVAIQDGWVCVWFCVLSDAPKENRLFYVTGTGDEVPLKDSYVGSTSTNNESLQWHVWERNT